MQEVLAGLTTLRFDIEIALEQQLGALPLPFPGMDKSGAAVCDFFVNSVCSKGTACPFRHVKGDRTVVCKHWLRGLCKKGDQCEFLHEYDMSKMPECYFYSRFSACSNKECPFLHIDPESKIKDCPWYDRGFCRHGPSCRHRHTRRVMCINYMCGFCLEGSECKFMHPQFELPMPEVQQTKKSNIVCHYCQEAGHKIVQCPNLPEDVREQQQQMRQHQHQRVQQIHREVEYIPSKPPDQGGMAADVIERKGFGQGRNYRPLDEVTCYKCGEKGHYANKCPKGHLAFLSSALQGPEK